MNAITHNYRMPAEWERHRRCWMAFPWKPEIWGKGLLKQVQHDIALIARTIAQYEPVVMLVHPEAEHDADKIVDKNENITLKQFVVSDCWTRDTCPTFVNKPDSGLAAVIWGFNVWGELQKYRTYYGEDRSLAKNLAEHLGLPVVRSWHVMEGGAVHVDGAGTILTTKSVVEHRLPGMSLEDVGQELCTLLRGTKVIWLPGCPSEKMTHGHVDGIACFAKPGQVIAEVTADTSDPEYLDMQDNLEQLKNAVDARGQALDLTVLQRPALRNEWGEEFCSSYVNFYIANGAVIMPGFGEEHADAVAKAKLEQVFSPERKIEQIPIKHLAKGGGGIHCVTQQEPID